MISRDPADIIAELHRLRDLARRICDPYDLGKHAHRDIRHAAREALAGQDPIIPRRAHEPTHRD